MSYFPNQGQQVVDRSQSITPATDCPQFPTGNVIKKYRTNCDTLPNAGEWVSTVGNGDILRLDGNCQGASYWVISKSPFNVGTDTVIDGIETFKMPIEASFGVHRSQAALGQEFSIQLVDSAAPAAPPADVAVSALSQATTTLTVTTSAPHNLAAGQCVGIYGCADSRFNYGALVVASVTGPTTFTATAGPGGNIASLTASPAVLGSPFVYVRRRLGGSSDGTSMIFENATATNASFYVRANSGDAVASGTASGNQSITVLTTASSQPINAFGAYSFFPSTEYKLNLALDRVQWFDASSDAITVTNSRYPRTSLCPDPDKLYKARIVASNVKGLTAPVGRIVSATKISSTTATIVFAEPHNLTVDDYLVGYGSSNQAATAFANLTTATKVASIVSPTSITIVWGTSGTATAYGGYMSRVQGGAAQNGAIAQVFQSVSITGGVLTVTGNATWAGLSVGDLVDIYGVRESVAGADLGIDGVYIVKGLSTTTLTLETIPGGPSPANLALTNCGGGVIKRTDLRVSYIRIFEFLRERVEFTPRPSTDAAAGVPVNIASSATLSITGSTAGTVAVDTAIGNPITVGMRASNANIAAMSASGRNVGWLGTMIGAGIVKPYALPEAQFDASLSLTTTTATAIQAAAAAGIKRHLVSLQAINTGAATVDLIILDGVTEKWRLPLPVNVPVDIEFPTHLNTTAATALNANLSAAGTVRANFQGYTAP